MMAALLAARGNRVMYEFAQHLVAEVKIIPPMQIAGPGNTCLSSLIRINEFGVKHEHLNTHSCLFLRSAGMILKQFCFLICIKIFQINHHQSSASIFTLVFLCYHFKSWCFSQLEFPSSTQDYCSAPSLMKGVSLQ